MSRRRDGWVRCPTCHSPIFRTRRPLTSPGGPPEVAPGAIVEPYFRRMVAAGDEFVIDWAAGPGAYRCPRGHWHHPDNPATV